MPSAFKNPPRLTWQLLAEEPFRIFFPAAVVAGLFGVLLWPLHFSGLYDSYPGVAHTRLMAHGFFGGFILGFLGTALPRMLSVRRFTVWEVTVIFALYASMVFSHGSGHTRVGDAFLLGLLGFLAITVAGRLRKRRDLPPPGFITVPMAFACAGVGALLSINEVKLEDTPRWIILGRLLLTQGFVLLPVLGVGGFILPRFLGLPNRHDFPESIVPTPDWSRRALLAAGAGAVIIGSFFIEVFLNARLGHAVRLLFTVLYLASEIPFHKSGLEGNALALSLKTAFVLLLAGLLAVVLLPSQRVAMLHLTLVGGLGTVVLIVATRVVFGHSGNLVRLQERNRWLLVALGLMLLGLATRVTGDFLPKILATHYSYGALAWAAGVVVWACYTLPKVLVPDPEM